MSRVIQQIATVQFQVDNRKVTASMNALQTEAESLNGKIAAVKQSIKSLGDVPTDNKFLLDYQKQLRQLNSDLKDVTTAQRDLMKGVKAADQLWKAAQTQDIESLSIKAIKAGQNGLRKRMENLRPELGGDDAKMYDAYKAVIEEADRVIKVFQADATSVVQVIRDGGVVSEQVMKRTRDALKDMIEAEKEGTAEQRQLAQQYDFLNESLANVAEMRRREKGEIVNANDARHEALKLTEDGIAAARRERDMADTVIAGMQQQKSDLDQLRRFHEDRIAQIEREIATNQRLEEAEQDRLADVEKAMRYNENEDQKSAIRLRKKADATKEEAELLDAIARRNEAVGESQAKIDRSRQRANEKLAEYISLNQKAEQMEEKVAHQEERHAEAMDHQSERLRQIRAEGERLLTQYEQQKAAIQNVDKAWADADVKQGEAEARKAQNQELTTKSIEDSIRKLKEANAVIDTNSDEWEENTRIIRKLQQAQDEISQKQKEMMGEWMSYAEAEKFAAQAGTEGFIATGQQMQQAQQALERRRDALIKSIQVRRQEKNMTDEQKEALAAEEAQLEKVNAELKKMKFEMENTNMSAKRMKEILDNPSAAKNIEELGQAVKRAQAQLKMMEDTVGNTNKEYQEMAQKTKEAAQRQKELEVQFKASASAFDKAWSRLKTYVGLYVGASVAMNKLMGTMGDLMDLSDKMGEVRKTTGFTADEVGRLTGELKKLDVRTSLVELMEVSAAAGQLGLKTEEDVLGFTEAANKLMIALPEMGKEAATEMMRVAIATGEVDKIRKQLQEGTVEGSSATAVAMEKIASTIDRLRATSAATAPEITDFVKRVGAVGAQSGISIDQVAALGSTISSLGMRVEMSATALSRMIPAIRRNAFDVAKAIGMAPEALRKMFDEAGGGMNAMLAIFRHIKDSGMNEDSIEKMLGMGDMAEIMKELNQQGARAGIVFAGLSQNVDELEKQLAIASDAYERNVAVQNEFNKMNETAAAKWARVKNQLEELLVSDKMQRMFGNIIDGLRKIVDLIAGDSGISGAVRYIILYLSIFKAKWAEAIGAGIISTGKFIWSMRASAVAAEADAAAKTADAAATASLGDATETTTKKTNLFKSAWGRMNDAMKANFITAAAMGLVYLGTVLWDAHKAAQKAADSVRRVKENTDEEKAAVKQLFRPLKDANLQHDDKVKLIKSINSQYGTYLSKMLTEASNAQDIARAYEAINLQLERKNILEGMESNKKDVQERRKGLLDSAYNEMDSAVGKAAKTGVDASRISSYISKKVSEAVEQGLSPDQMRRSIQEELGKEIKSGGMKKYVQIISGGLSRRESADSYIAYAAKRYYDAQMKVQGEVNTANKRLQSDLDNVVGKVRDAASKDIPTLVSDFDKALGKGTDAKKYNAKESAAVVEAFDAIKAYYDLHRDDLTAEQKKLLDAKLGVDVSTFKNKVKSSGGGGGGGGNIWGSTAPADSTDYGTWDVNELVARRNQMDKFKNVLKPDTDIRAVLAEDKALMKALDNGLKEDWKSVIGWYNTERKKIQEELKSERFSTNEGHWRDEKQGRGRRNRFRESDYALAELDRYYSKRKEDLEKARIEENMSEELFNRQAELLEQEHLERRSKLRETFTAGSTEQEKKMVKQFREWWDQLEKQGLLDEVPWATVESEWSKALASEIGRNNLRAQQDLTKLQEITVKHLNEIAKLIDKERPYDGITANLRKNLTEMDILLADMQKDGPEKDTAKLVKAETIRLKFLLSESEQAYSLNFEQLKEKMVKEGFGEWAQAIEGDEQLKQSLMQNLRNTYDAIQEAIKKESSVIKKQLEIQWNDMMPGSDMSMKGTFEKAISDLGLAGDRVKRANSLIGAGMASDRVADKLAIQQMRIQLQMQETYFALMQKIGRERIKQLEQSAVANEREAKALKEKAELLRKEGKTAEAEVTELKAQNALRQSLQDKFDAEHAAKSLSLARTKELAEEEKQRVAIANQLEETQNRLYTELRSWVDLFTSSLQSVFEASHAGDAEYYNERAKLNLTGKGGPGAGTYVVIENEGTEDAVAHYEYLDEREALERQREIENDNAVAEAWEKVMNDINMKISDTITDQLNAMLQNQAIDANTQAVIANTQALYATMGQGGVSNFSDASGLQRDENGMALDSNGNIVYPIQPTEQSEDMPAWKPFWQMTAEEMEMNKQNMTDMFGFYRDMTVQTEAEKAAMLSEIEGYQPSPIMYSDEQIESLNEKRNMLADEEIAADKRVTDAKLANQKSVSAGQIRTDGQVVESNNSAFAKMTRAVNLYGAAYQAMSNSNLSMTQKLAVVALQAVGEMAMKGLEVMVEQMTAKKAAKTAETLGEDTSQHGTILGHIIWAAGTAILGGLMGLATSAVSKSKGKIASITGVSSGAGRISTGMLTYAEGNVNEFTDPSSLTPGRSYNVDGADGKTYRAKYTGTDPKTHITSGPEFHLVGEAGQEAIIDAKTTRQIRMNDTGIWQAIQTLYNGGRLSSSQRRRMRRGVPAFADGNIDEFSEMADDGVMTTGSGMGAEQMAAFQQSLDRNNELLERALSEGIHAHFDVYGEGGLVDSYDRGKKTVSSHGEPY